MLRAAVDVRWSFPREKSIINFLRAVKGRGAKGVTGSRVWRGSVPTSEGQHHEEPRPPALPSGTLAPHKLWTVDLAGLQMEGSANLHDMNAVPT